MANSLKLKRGSARWLTFELTDDNGQGVNLTGCTYSYQAKKFKEDATPAISKGDADFDKSSQAAGRVLVFIDTASLEAGDYIGEWKAVFPGGDEFISDDLPLEIEGAVHAAS